MQQALERLAGVQRAVVDRGKKEARVTVENGASPQEMVAAIQRAGKFQAKFLG